MDILERLCVLVLVVAGILVPLVLLLSCFLLFRCSARLKKLLDALPDQRRTGSLEDPRPRTTTAAAPAVVAPAPVPVPLPVSVAASMPAPVVSAPAPIATPASVPMPPSTPVAAPALVAAPASAPAPAAVGRRDWRVVVRESAPVRGVRRLLAHLAGMGGRALMLRNWFCYGHFTAEAVADSDKEKLAASCWLLRGGILISLLTAGFLLKLSIDHGILAPVWRVALTAACATGLFLWGTRLAPGRYGRLGQGFLGLGLAMYYFGGYAAGSMYGLLPAGACGAFMVLVTVCAGLLADRLESLGIALVAILGGYGTPMVLGGGAGSLPGLFGYMFVLGCGVIWLSRRRDWLPLQWLGLAFTYFLFHQAVLARPFPRAWYPLVQAALVLFFLQYSLAFVAYQLKRGLRLSILETWAFLVHSFVFFGMNWLVLARMHPPRLALSLLPLGLSLFHVVLVQTILVRRYRDRLLLVSCIGLAGFYLALVFPVALSGRWLGAGWALQALLMVWLGFSLDSRFTRRMGWLLFGVCLLRLCFWDLTGAGLIRYGSQEAFWRLLLERVLGYVVPIGALGAAAHLERHPPARFGGLAGDGGAAAPGEDWALLPFRALFLGIVLLFLYLNLEAGNVCRHVWAPFGEPVRIWLWGIAGIVLVRHGKALGVTSPRLRRILAWTLLLGMAGPLCLRIAAILVAAGRTAAFSWATSACSIFSVFSLAFLMWQLSGLLGDSDVRIARFASLTWPVLLFLHLTADVDLITTCRLTGFRGGGVSVLWSAFAFVMVHRGLRRRSQGLRLGGLALFLVVMGKVLFFDLDFLNAYYRVVAFLLFGLLLIGGSWSYLKLWRNGKAGERNRDDE